MEWIALLGALLFAAIAAAVRWHYWRQYKARHADKLLFLTHTPNAYQPGEIYDGNVITRLAQVGPTALADGGRALCWEVYGRPNGHANRAEPGRGNT